MTMGLGAFGLSAGLSAGLLASAGDPGVAGGVALELEDRAAQGRLEEARPLVARLETMAGELMRLVGGLSLDALREQAGAAGSSDWAAGP